MTWLFLPVAVVILVAAALIVGRIESHRGLHTDDDQG